ncbi:MAG TPA: hypothetical protein VEK08_00380 [Planctomycetota bacterium]|nr:hypothetical protein [Planctomycetota bacterium]
MNADEIQHYLYQVYPPFLLREKLAQKAREQSMTADRFDALMCEYWIGYLEKVQAPSISGAAQKLRQAGLEATVLRALTQHLEEVAAGAVAFDDVDEEAKETEFLTQLQSEFIQRARESALQILSDPKLRRIEGVEYGRLKNAICEACDHLQEHGRKDLALSKEIKRAAELISSAADVPDEPPEKDAPGQGTFFESEAPKVPECPDGIGPVFHQQYTERLRKLPLAAVLTRSTFEEDDGDDSVKSGWLAGIAEQGFIKHNDKKGRGSAYVKIKNF